MNPGEHTPKYCTPPEPVVSLIDAPLTPHIQVAPGRDWILLLEPSKLPSIADLSRPELALAGMRIDPGTSGPSRQDHYTTLRLKRLADGLERVVEGVPDLGRIGAVRWAPDGARLAFGVCNESGIALWVAEVETGQARPLTDPCLNAVFGSSLAWGADSRSLICTMVPPDRGKAPLTPLVPTGPVIQEHTGSESPARTYQNLLENPHDEALFEYYGTAQAAWVDLEGGVQPVGPAGLLSQVSSSPDGRFLLVETLHRPFSYLVPYDRFPCRVEIWDRDGDVVRQIVDLPLAERVPLSFDAVAEGPRHFTWRADAAATLCWVEAQDGGDPRQEKVVRDRVYVWEAPFEGLPQVLAELSLRFAGLAWGSDDLALVYEHWWHSRQVQSWRVAPGLPKAEAQLLFDRSWEDRYGDPGQPLMRWTPQGSQVLLTSRDGASLYLSGDGASPEGDRPFLDRLNMATGQTERLWRSEAPHYEGLVQVLDVDNLRLLTHRESTAEPPNYHVRQLRQGSTQPLTALPHPALELRELHKELIRYRRRDGVELSGTLYLPPGHRPQDGPLPLLMWAYPREFKNADMAGQVTDSPYRFVRVHTHSPLFLLMQGYAVLDGPTMPIVGAAAAEANDTYLEQLVASAEAAVEEVVRLGVAQREKIAVGGHSYGAFMTANLLAHTDLFRAGIAHSGAYNRTLTPFGFQAEERTLWEVPQVYAAISPFMHADKINAPLLLIHGEADNNTGTFPLQSERFYRALKGHGATARLVLLPHESHAYRARESVMHTLWEMGTWLDRYLKNES